MNLKISLLGNISIEYCGKKVSFELRKAEALLCYIMINGEATRDELKAMFWYNKNETQASANLRNALYLINNTIPGVISVSRYVIKGSDFDNGMSEIDAIADPNTPIPPAVYCTPLTGLSFSNSPAFSEWTDGIRDKIKNRIIELVKQRIEAAYDMQDNEKLWESLTAAHRLDPFDEDSVLELMELYSSVGQSNRAAELFQNYSLLLKSKLAIAPSERAQDFYTKITGLQNRNSGHAKFWCRERELALIIGSLAEAEPCITFIHGEAGIGKTALINELITRTPKERTVIFTAKASLIGEGYAYSSWNNILGEMRPLLDKAGVLSDKKTASILAGISPGFIKDETISFNADLSSVTNINPVVVASLLSDFINTLAQHTHVIMIFEDIHWFDKSSLELLWSFLSYGPHADVIISSRPEAAKSSEAILRRIKGSRRAASIELKPFCDEEIKYISQSILPESTVKGLGLPYFIRVSEGVPLMLFEVLHTLKANPDADCTQGLCGLITERIGELSPQERAVLGAIAVCASASMEAVAEMTSLSIEETLASSERLTAMGLIIERETNNTASWEFTHLTLRECVYLSIPASRRKELHRRAAEALSKRYLPQHWNPELSSMLSHHYAKAGERVLELKQYLRELIFDITLNHDLFPTLSDRLFLSCSMPYSSRGETDKKVERAVSILDELRDSAALSKTEFAQLEASCYELAGGYRISWGEYSGAKLYTDEAIRISQKYGFTQTHIHCLKHYAYMYLQIEEADKLITAARELLRLSKKAPAPHYFATAIRFIGMGYMMKQDYNRAEKIFLYTVKLFDQMTLTGRRYTLGKLVAKCYLAEIYERTGRLAEAAAWISECTGTCEEMDMYWGRSYFHTCAANIALDSGDMEGLFRNIDIAASLFESCRGGRCGSILYSTKAIADTERGRFDAAHKALEDSALLLSHVAKRDWVSTHKMAEAWLAKAEGRDFENTALEAMRRFSANGFELRAGMIKEKFCLQQRNNGD